MKRANKSHWCLLRCLFHVAFISLSFVLRPSRWFRHLSLPSLPLSCSHSLPLLFDRVSNPHTESCPFCLTVKCQTTARSWSQSWCQMLLGTQTTRRGKDEITALVVIHRSSCFASKDEFQCFTEGKVQISTANCHRWSFLRAEVLKWSDLLEQVKQPIDLNKTTIVRRNLWASERNQSGL